MATAPLIRYLLDPTGTDANNAVKAEIRSLSVTQVRAVAPKYSPFFTESLVVLDNANNKPLVRGVDYQCVDLLQDATMKYGKEIAQIILIINPTVSGVISLSYQVLGGYYQSNVDGLVDMYNSVMSDIRPVDWTNVVDTPVQYPPTLHTHLLDDVYGFEAIVASLERVRNAIVLSDIPAFETLINWIKSRGMTIADWQNGTIADKFVTGDVMNFIINQYQLKIPVPVIPPKKNTPMELFTACCLYNPKIIINATSMYIVGSR